MDKSLPIGLVLVLAFGCARGQDLKAAQGCSRLSDDAARLSCYDAALGAAKPPAAKPPNAKPPNAQHPGLAGDGCTVEIRR